MRWSAPGIRGLGKSCEAAIDHLERASGTMTLEELAYAMGVSRVRDFRRRVDSRLEAAGVVECSSDVVSLVEGWLEALNEERESAGEIAAYRRDMAKYDRERAGYRKRYENKPDRSPSQAEMRAAREGGLFREHPEYRGWRVGQITCQLMFYLPEDFPRSPDGSPKDAEVGSILDGVAA